MTYEKAPTTDHFIQAAEIEYEQQNAHTRMVDEIYTNQSRKEDAGFESIDPQSIDLYASTKQSEGPLDYRENATGVPQDFSYDFERNIPYDGPSALEFLQNINYSFDHFDKDQDDIISQTEIDQVKHEHGSNFDLANTAKIMETHYDNLRLLNTDSIFFDDQGISRKDLTVLALAKLHGIASIEAIRKSQQADSIHIGGKVVPYLAVKGCDWIKAVVPGTAASTITKATIAGLKYKYLTEPKLEAIINDLH